MDDQEQDLCFSTPFKTSTNTHTPRVKIRESRHGESSDITTLKDKVVDLMMDEDYQKFTDLILFQRLEIIWMLLRLEIHPVIKGELHKNKAEADKSNVDANEVQIVIREKSIYEDFPDHEDTIVYSVIQTSRPEIFTVFSCRESLSKVILGTKAHDPSDSPDTHAKIDGASV